MCSYLAEFIRLFGTYRHEGFLSQCRLKVLNQILKHCEAELIDSCLQILISVLLTYGTSKIHWKIIISQNIEEMLVELQLTLLSQIFFICSSGHTEITI